MEETLKKIHKDEHAQFIKTQNRETAELLRKRGFTEIKTQDKLWFHFMNDGIAEFSEGEKKRMHFTHILPL